MRSVLTVFLHPRIEISLQPLQRPIDLLPKRDPIEFIEHGFMEALADPIGLGMSCLGSGMVDVLHGQVEFIFMAFGCPTILGLAVGQRTAQRNLLLFEEWEYPIIQEISGHHWGFTIIQFREPNFAVGVDERLLIDPPHALQCPHIEGVLGTAVARALASRIRRGLLCLRSLFYN